MMSKLFQKNSLYIRIYADFEAKNWIDIYSIGNKTTITYKQNPRCNGQNTVSELKDFLQCGFIESPLGFDNIDWFLDEARKIENIKTFFSKKVQQKYYINWRRWKTI